LEIYNIRRHCIIGCRDFGSRLDELGKKPEWKTKQPSEPSQCEQGSQCVGEIETGHLDIVVCNLAVDSLTRNKNWHDPHNSH